MKLDGHKTLLFDCDGVVLDSNRIKTEAFQRAAAPYGKVAADALVAHHRYNGGVSRYRKFEHFLEVIAPAYAPVLTDTTDAGRSGPGLEALLQRYAEAVHQGLRECAIAEGLAALRAATPQARWLVASGGDQRELQAVFAERDIAEWFDGGIFGSPASKHDIVAKGLAEGRIISPALFLGDSRMDHEVAEAHGLDFVFVSGWTEMPGWRAYTAAHQLPVVESVASLMTAAEGIVETR
mgnify:CR=1 FL=1